MVLDKFFPNFLFLKSFNVLLNIFWAFSNNSYKKIGPVMYGDGE